LEGNKVKLSVNIEEAEFDRSIDQAFKKLAREVRLPGFRAGKAPRRVLEARIGLAPARAQALQDSIPEFLAKAVREHDVDLVATPDVEITSGEEEGPVEFDATCEVRPQITVPGYSGLRIELPAPTASEAEIDEAMTAERRRHGTLTDVERPAATGDYVTLDLTATRDGEEVTGLNTEDWSYEIGQGWVAEDFDEQLIGVTAGETLEFTTTPKGTEEEADFVVIVTKVQELVLPDVDDEWVADHLGEFDTVDEWRQSVADRISEMKLNRIRQELVGKVTEALVGLTDIEAPESMVTADLQRRVQSTVQQLQANGISMDQWMSATGQDANAFVEGLRGQSEQAVKVDLALRAVASAEELDADEGDFDAEYQRIAMQVNEKAAKVQQAYERNDLVPELAAQIRKSKALDWLLHHVEIVDPEGQPIDRDLVLGHTHGPDGEHLPGAADDHDHGDHGDADADHADHADHGDVDHDHDDETERLPS
jgi:trigger factor